MKAWQLERAELLFSFSDTGSVILGVLEGAVFSLWDCGLVRISQPPDGTKTVESRLENSERGVTPVSCVTLPRRGKLFMVSKEGLLYQVR